MNLHRILFATLVVCIATSGCELFGGGGGGEGGGQGGGGGTQAISFTRGFTYVRKDDRNVYLVDDKDLDTTGTLTSSGGVLNPSLSKNGKQVVFVIKNDTTTSVNTVLTSGGAPTTLITSDSMRTNFHHPVFSPDGMTVAFSYDEGGSGSIGLINSDGSNFRKLIGGGALTYALPSFATDGKSILAAAGNAGLLLTQIERIDLTTTNATSITNTLGNEAVNIANRLVVSPDGTKAVFDARVSSGVTRVFVIDLGSKVVSGLNTYMGESNVNDSSPTWYDASTVAYSSDSGGNDNVYTVSITSGGTDRHLLLAKAVEPWYGPL